jgi:UrcA family protein
MKTAIVKGFTLGAIALTSFLTAHSASAAPQNDGPRTAVVKYQDLDLSQPRDLKKLYGRIKAAAQAVCDNTPEADLHRLAIYKNCIRNAVSNGMSQVQSSQQTNIRQAQAPSDIR